MDELQIVKKKFPPKSVGAWRSAALLKLLRGYKAMPGYIAASRPKVIMQRCTMSIVFGSPLRKQEKSSKSASWSLKKGNDKDTESLVGTFVLKTVLKFACVERSPA